MTHHQNQDTRACIEACQSCHEVCIATTTYCLTHGGKHAAVDHIRTLTDCVQMCETSADFMLRESELHAHVCDACADICEQCAASCGQLDGAEMKRCADECRRCAEQCRAMARAAA